MSIPPIKEIRTAFSTHEEAINYLISKKVIIVPLECAFCDGNVSRCGLLVRCTTKTCRKATSILKFTAFSNTRFKMHLLLHCIYLWLTGCTATMIHTILGISFAAVARVIKRCNDVFLESHSYGFDKIGGEGIVVKVDESKFGKVKHHRGHRVEGVWIVGGVERTSKKRCFFTKTESRSKEALTSIIKKYVNEGSVIATDCWRGYSGLQNHGFTHQTVNHSRFFRDPSTGVHTNSIEGKWSALKAKTRARNRCKAKIDSFLLKKMWLGENKDSFWYSFLECLYAFFNN